jgi:hypothetical protein
MSYAMSHVRLARTCKKRTMSYVFRRYRMLHVQCRIKHVRCCILHRIRHRYIARTTGKNLYFDIRYRTSDVRYLIRYCIRYMHEQKLFRSHHNTSLSLLALFRPGLLKTAMTRIVHGIRMMKGIMVPFKQRKRPPLKDVRHRTSDVRRIRFAWTSVPALLGRRFRNWVPYPIPIGCLYWVSYPIPIGCPLV